VRKVRRCELCNAPESHTPACQQLLKIWKAAAELVLVGSAETGHLPHTARGYFSEIATAWERFLDGLRIRQRTPRLTDRLSGCATHARSRWDGKRSGKNSLMRYC